MPSSRMTTLRNACGHALHMWSCDVLRPLGRRQLALTWQTSQEHLPQRISGCRGASVREKGAYGVSDAKLFGCGRWGSLEPPGSISGSVSANDFQAARKKSERRANRLNRLHLASGWGRFRCRARASSVSGGCSSFEQLVMCCIGLSG